MQVRGYRGDTVIHIGKLYREVQLSKVTWGRREGMSEDLIVGVIVGALIVGFLSASICWNVTTNKWQEDLIRKGYAEYNRTTGVWQYKEGK